MDNKFLISAVVVIVAILTAVFIAFPEIYKEKESPLWLWLLKLGAILILYAIMVVAMMTRGDLAVLF